MRSLAEQIEDYLKKLLSSSSKGLVEVQRNELAQHFDCVPSQISYVLSTRFSTEQGYLVESRRGGGGFVRITRFSLERETELRKLIDAIDGQMISQQTGEGLIEHLVEEELLSQRECLLMKAVIRRESLPLGLPERDMVRASLLRGMLLVLLCEMPAS